jgi:hypothetical protein
VNTIIPYRRSCAGNPVADEKIGDADQDQIVVLMNFKEIPRQEKKLTRYDC